ncbi:MAG: hypothetical protein LBF36_02355 [Mycoplasmataceae bacterium]|jgi:riboflavin kinase/FMN adenylyltransferase|nr:hypothetical protein [Mycoplasmataceae bacterium]
MSKILHFHQIQTSSHLPLVIGFFDGLHKGHLRLFQGLNKRQFNILTFINIPNKSKNLLYSDNKRIADLEQLAPANIFLLDLQKHNLLAMTFIHRLSKNIQPSHIIVGSDFQFGKHRHGNISQLKEFYHVKTIKITPKYKTTNIKKYILNGNIPMANKLLFEPYTLTGVVKHGKGIGHKLGYPTANINLGNNVIQPKEGSYQAFTYINKVKYPSAVFIHNHLLETHIFHFHKDIYEKIISIQLIKYHQTMNQTNNFTSLKKIIKYKVQSIQSQFK